MPTAISILNWTNCLERKKQVHDLFIIVMLVWMKSTYRENKIK